MRYDDVLSELGDFGKYQKIVYFAICLPLMFEGMQIMSPVFILATPKHRCAIPGLANDTFAIQSDTHADLVKTFIPIDETGEYSKCVLFNVDPYLTTGNVVLADTESVLNTRNIASTNTESVINTSYIALTDTESVMNTRNIALTNTKSVINTRDIALTDTESVINTSYIALESVLNTTSNMTSLNTMPCDRWVYDTSYFHDTVTTEIDLVCSRTMYRAHATMAMNIGALVSFVALGTVADKYGRKQATMGELILMALCACLLVWLPNIYIFIVIRVFIGIGFGVFYNACFIYAMEFVGSSKRTLCGMLQNFFWAVGILVQALLAYYIRTWRALQLAIPVPIFGVILYWWYLPNSGRWLMSQGHTKKCRTVFIRMAEVNEKKLDSDLLSVFSVQPSEHYEKTESFLKIFKSRKLTTRTLIVFWNWYTINLLYLGLSLNVGNLSGDIYANFTISCIMEMVGYAVCFPGLHWLGRKKFHCSCMIVGGIVLLVTIIPQVYGTAGIQWLVVVLAMAGKLVSSAAYATIYLFSAELFPTVVRAGTMGICCAIATFGGMTAPYIVELVNILEGNLATIVPLLIFGITSLSAGALALFLPETRRSQLPDTIADMKRQGQRT